MAQRPCVGCGELISSGSRCRDCRPKRTAPSATRRGYPEWWNRLSKRARELQPWCACGAIDHLTVDHTPASWLKVEAGQRLTLNDFRNGLLIVRCQRCNNSAGAARGANVTRTD